MSLKSFPKVFCRQGGRFNDNDIKSRLFLLFGRRDELKRSNIRTATDIHMKTQQTRHDHPNNPHHNNIHKDNPLFGLRDVLVLRIFNQHPNPHYHAQNREENEHKQQPDKVLIIPDPDTIIQVLAMVIEILRTPVARHTVVTGALHS